MALSGSSRKIETTWDNLRLIVEQHPEEGSYVLFVYDINNCEVLYTAQRISSDDAKIAAVEFAIAHLYTTDHDLKAEVLAKMFVWESV